MDAVKVTVAWLFIGLVSIINGHPAPQIFDSPDAKIDIFGSTNFDLTTTPVPTITFAKTSTPPTITTLKPGPTTIDPRAACGGLKGFLRLCDVPEDVKDEPKHTRNQRDAPKEIKQDPKDAANKKIKDAKSTVTEHVPSGIPSVSKVQPQAVTKPKKRDVKEVTRPHSSTEKAKPQTKSPAKAGTKKNNTTPPTTTTTKKTN